jgi:hypothetical protein
MDYSKMHLRKLHNLVHLVKRLYLHDINSMNKEQCIEILNKFEIPTKDVITVIKKSIPDKTKKDDDYDF